jgi:hypothetical protein
LRFISRNALALVALAWALCIVAASLFANDAKETLGTGVHMRMLKNTSGWPVVPVRHSIMHFLPFGSLALLLVFITRDMRSRLLLTFAVGALGLGIEYAQYQIFGGEFEWWDLRDDSLGAIAGFLIASCAVLGRRKVQDRRKG